MIEREIRDGRSAGKSEEAHIGIQGIFLSSADESGHRTGEWAEHTAAGGLLAREQRRRNDAVEKPGTGAHDDIPPGADVVGKTQARVNVLILIIQCSARPGFKLPAHSAVNGQPVGGAPFILNVQTVIGVVQSALR